MDDPEYPRIREVVARTLQLSVALNTATDLDEVRALLGQIIGAPLDASTTVFPPFYTNFGRFIELGRNVFVNHGCTFLDLGGITVEDDVLIGPKVSLISEDHPIDPAERRTLIPKAVRIRRGAWIGANATILPGVTVGENAVVAAGALVTKDVPDHTVVGGVPARVMKSLG
ncbi:MAG: sugar O-acetyltransferase [Lewinella sp.]|nr:sugar O-acetyltransferase [Lewinella sp.]